MASHFFGPLGAMAPLVVSTGVAVQTARGFSEFVSSGGVRHIQQGRTAPRTWTVGRRWKDPQWVRLLSMAAHGLLENCWLYDVAEARDNMVPAVLSAGGGTRRRRNLLVNPGFDGLPGTGWAARANITYTRDGEWMRAAYGAAVANQIPVNSSTFPTEAGRSYTSSVTVRNNGTTSESVYIRHYPGANGGSDASGPVVVIPAGGSARLSVTSKTVPATESSASLFLYCTTYKAGQTVLAFKDPVAEEGPTDGGPLNGNMPGAIWEGAANRSPSSMVIKARINAGGIPLEVLPSGHQVQVPVLAGRLYTVSGWTDRNAGPAIQYVVGGSPVHAIAAVNGLAEHSFTSPVDDILTVTVITPHVSGLRVHDGPPDGRFMAGHGTPCKVAVQDPVRTLQMVTEDTISDYEATLMEVGKPGTI